MKTFILIRFDKAPRRDVTEVLVKYINAEDSQFISTPSTMITLFKSESSYKEMYLAISSLRPITAFFLIDVTGADFAIHMPNEITKALSEFLGKSMVDKAEHSDIDALSIKELTESLRNAVEIENFELASRLRDKISEKQDNK